MMNYVTLIWVLAVKDLRSEYRSRQAFLITLFFAFLILVIFQFAFHPGSQATREASVGILWVALLFPGIIQLNRSFQVEREEGTLYGILLAPIDRGVLFFGKFLANWFFLVVIDLLILVAFVILFNLTFEIILGWILLLLLLASIGFAAVGTLFAAMVSSIRAREVLLPILLFPIIVPTIIAAVSGTREVLLDQELFRLFQWVRLLLAFDVIFLASCFLVFEYVVED